MGGVGHGFCSAKRHLLFFFLGIKALAFFFLGYKALAFFAWGVVLPIAELARIAELAHKIVQLAELARASSCF